MTETVKKRNDRIFKEATKAGEPVFVLRAKDRLSLPTLEGYRNLAVAAGVDQAFLIALDEVSADVRLWQEENPEQLKVPDVR